MNKTQPFTRKKIEDYSYGLSDIIGKGYSSQVYKGRHDNSCNLFFIGRGTRCSQSYRYENAEEWD